jgi:AmmeMemoRadiSam system protein B
LVVPHAGYLYSGPVAATAYALLACSAALPERAAVLGPAHFAYVRGAAIPAATVWETPLGPVQVDEALRVAAESIGPGVVVDDEPHEPEHAVEVQLPFLQRVLGPGCSVLPVAVGLAQPGEVADLIETLLEVPAALLVVSTDLSHYHDAETARSLDRRTAQAVVAGDLGAIGADAACGGSALRGAVAYATRYGLRLDVLDLRTSAETEGDPVRVVGYGAFSLSAGARR